MPSDRSDPLTGILLAALIAAVWLASLLVALQQPLQQMGLAELMGLVLIRTLSQTGLFIIAHDAMHGSLLPALPRWNRRIGAVALLLYAGLSFRRCQRNHLSHHRHSETAADPDYHRPGQPQIHRWYGAFMGRYLSAWQLLRLGLIWLGVTAAASMTHPLAGVNVVSFCIIPLVLSSLQLFVVGTWLPHRCASPAEVAVTPRSLPMHPVVSLAACYHFGYHFEHHKFPYTPWFRLPLMRDCNNSV